jgi:hypothetical protein
MELLPTLTTLVVNIPIFRMPSSLGVALCFPWGATPTTHLQILENPKGVVFK